MTIHRAYGYVDRANLREGAPLRVVMATEGRKADGIDLRMSGAQLDRYRANPVLGYGHSYWGRGNLPIGRVSPESVSVDGQMLCGDLEFDPGDEFAREVERKMRAGFLNAVSIGFDVTKWESENDNYWRGGVAEEWELTELSVVPVPMDADAVVTAGRHLSDDEVEQLIARFRASLGKSPMILPHDVTITPIEPETAPEPPAQGINPDAARDFLAAFTTRSNT